jgi:hypothetical protein
MKCRERAIYLPIPRHSPSRIPLTVVLFVLVPCSFVATAKMRTVLALLLAFCISHAAAFGVAGAYERMLYWNAYQMDPEDGDERTVGPGCTSCNFAEFMAYIEVTKKDEAPDLLRGLNPTNVDEGARMLNERGLNEVYDSGRIADVNQPFAAFRIVSK